MHFPTKKMGVIFCVAKKDTTGGGVRGCFVFRTQFFPSQFFEYLPNTTHLCSALSAGSLRSWSPSQGGGSPSQGSPLVLDSPLFPSRHARRLGFVAWLKWWSWWWSIGQVWKWWFSQWFENGKGNRKMRILTRVQWTKHIQCRYSGNPGFNKKNARKSTRRCARFTCIDCIQCIDCEDCEDRRDWRDWRECRGCRGCGAADCTDFTDWNHCINWRSEKVWVTYLLTYTYWQLESKRC